MTIKKHIYILLISFFVLSITLNAATSSEHDRLEKESISILEWIPIIYDDIISFFSKDKKQDRTNTLAGVDTDHNGVRDDIDAYINTHYSKPKERAAVIQMAKGLQKSLLVDKLNMNKIREVAREKMKAITCLSSLPISASPMYEIRSLTTNTKKRLLEYLKFSKALDGTTWSLPEGDTCE